MKPTQSQVGTQQTPARDSQLIVAFAPIATQNTGEIGAGGNPCLVHHLRTPATELPPVNPHLTQCQTWLTSCSGGNTVAVRCYSPGGKVIQCCGHGLLAAASSWLRRLQCDALTLEMNNSLVAGWHEEDVTWLRFELLPTSACALPGWLPEIFPGQPPAIAAAIAGDEQGYLVLQWPDGFDLTRLNQPGAGLSAHSQRALICTAAIPTAGVGTIRLRYFAPQYGIDEDTATGSAMRVLAHYWSPWCRQLSAQQCSAAGGYLRSRFASSRVEVGGHCIPLNATDSGASND